MRCASISIGIVDYADPAYAGSDMRLRYAVGDAEAFHRYVSLAWPSPDNARNLLLRDREAAVPEDVLGAVQAVAAHGPLDLFILYLSGHGEAGLDGRGWFCLSNARPGTPSLDSEGIDRCIAQVDADAILVFVDCCHAEAVVAKSQSFSIHQGRRARIVGASCRADQRSWEDDALKRSIFSDILLRGLSTDSPLANPTGQVDVQGKLLSYLRDQVPTAVSAAKRGQSQEPVTFGFMGGPLDMPVVSTASLGRPLSITEAIRVGVRRSLVSLLVMAILALAISDLLVYHLAVSSTGAILVRPGLASTYSFLPVHLVSDLDSGLSIRDISPKSDRLLAGLASGSIWGISTRRDDHGQKPWLAKLESGLIKTTLNPVRVLAFGASPKFDVNNDPAPVTEAVFLARLQRKSTLEVGQSLYPLDAGLSWACTDKVSNQLDFTILESETPVFERDTDFIATTASADPKARAQTLANLVKLSAYRAFHEENGDKRVAEFRVFVNAAELVTGTDPGDQFRQAVAPFLGSTKGTWCALHGSFVSAIAGDWQESLSGESNLRVVLQSFDRSKQGDLSSAEQSMAVIGLAHLGHHRQLDPNTIHAVYAIIERDGNLDAQMPATDLLKELATSQRFSPELSGLLFAKLESKDDLSQITAANLLGRNYRFLDPSQKEVLRRWFSKEAAPNAFVSDVHEAIGFISLYETIPEDQLRLLLARLSALSRFPPEATDYRGETVIEASGDKAAVALGRVAQSALLPADVTERLANFASGRPDLEGQGELVRGLAKQWYGKTRELTKDIQVRLSDCRRDANRRELEEEVAVSAVVDLPVSDRKQTLDQLVAAWSLEVEPSQRIALAKIIGHVGGA
jgi:Caspase domain